MFIASDWFVYLKDTNLHRLHQLVGITSLYSVSCCACGEIRYGAVINFRNLLINNKFPVYV